MKKLLLAFSVFLVFLAIILSCSKNDGANPTQPVTPDAINVVRDTGTGSLSALHRVSGDTFRVLFTPPLVSTDCNGSTLVCDTTDTARMAYRLNPAGDSLTIYRPDNNGDLDTLRYSRCGSGSGLIGTWKDSLVDFHSDYLDTVLENLVIRSDSSFLMTSISRINFSNYYLSQWLTSSFLTTESLTVSSLNCMTLSVRGEITNETDTIRMLHNRDIRFSSDKGVNLPDTFYANPVSCPNPAWPAWFDSLLTNNRKQ